VTCGPSSPTKGYRTFWSRTLALMLIAMGTLFTELPRASIPGSPVGVERAGVQQPRLLLVLSFFLAAFGF
jgi:hypothetical protein